MSGQMRLSKVLVMAIVMGLNRPISTFIDEQIRQRKGIGDYAAEAILQGLVRAAAISS